MTGSREPNDFGDSLSHWKHVPEALQYLQTWASKFGLRGLTVYFGQPPALNQLATDAELLELVTAYETIAKRGDAPAITAWCLSVRPGTSANEAKEHIRGLLLLFEQLAGRGLSPFTDGRVRFISPEPAPFNWSVLPPHLHEFEPWLKRFEALRTEADLFEYTQDASEVQLRELAALKSLLRRDGQALLQWCESHNVESNPAERKAFQAQWLFLLVDFAESRISEVMED